MRQSPQDLEVDIVRRSTREIVRGLGLFSRKAFDSSHTLEQVHVLSEIDKDPKITASRLSFLLNLDRSTISRLIKKLVEEELLVELGTGKDKRVKLFRLTKAGKALVEDARARSKVQIREILEFLGPEERDAVICGLELYAKAVRKAQELGMYVVRKIEPKDNKTMSKICRDVMLSFGVNGCNSSAADPEMDSLCEAYRKKGAEYWVLEKDGKIVGGGGFMQLKGADTTVCELQKMYFIDEVRGKGLGGRMLAMLIERMRACGYKACYLETVESMSKAHALYEAFGFDRLKSPMGSTGHTVCNIWYAKMLTD